MYHGEESTCVVMALMVLYFLGVCNLGASFWH